MEKTYISSTEISINVKVCGAHVHITFVPHTLGGSSFTTADTNLQQAMEKHRHFGCRFKLVDKGYTTTQVDNPETTHVEEHKKPETRSFVSLNDAKEYCAQTFGVSRTQLRTRAQITDAAAANGLNIIFE